MEEKINELIALLKDAEPVARELKYNFTPKSVGERDAYYTHSNIVRAIGHLQVLKAIIY